MKVIKPFIKLYFLFSILLMLSISFSLVVYQWGDSMSFLESIGLSREFFVNEMNILGTQMSLIELLIRTWVFNLGFSGFLAVTVYAVEEVMGFTSKTAMYALICNLVFALLVIILLRKVMGKKALGLGVI